METNIVMFMTIGVFVVVFSIVIIVLAAVGTFSSKDEPVIVTKLPCTNEVAFTQRGVIQGSFASHVYASPDMGVLFALTNDGHYVIFRSSDTYKQVQMLIEDVPLTPYCVVLDRQCVFASDTRLIKYDYSDTGKLSDRHVLDGVHVTGEMRSVTETSFSVLVDNNLIQRYDSNLQLKQSIPVANVVAHSCFGELTAVATSSAEVRIYRSIENVHVIVGVVASDMTFDVYGNLIIVNESTMYVYDSESFALLHTQDGGDKVQSLGNYLFVSNNLTMSAYDYFRLTQRFDTGACKNFVVGYRNNDLILITCHSSALDVYNSACI